MPPRMAASRICADRRPVERQLADLGVHPHHLEDGLSAAEADVRRSAPQPTGSVDAVPSPSSGEMSDELQQLADPGSDPSCLHVLAEHADQPLGHDRLDRAGHEERLDAHVDQTGDRRRGVVGVQRREDQVAGQGGLDRDLGHLAVADLADEDDVRRLTQHRPEDRRERQADALAHLALVDAGEVVLDRVLGGDDLAVRPVEHVERRVERRRLARAGRPGDEEDAVRPADDPVERRRAMSCSKPRLTQTDLDRVGPQNTQHDRLAVVRRDSD